MWLNFLTLPDLALQVADPAAWRPLLPDLTRCHCRPPSRPAQLDLALQVADPAAWRPFLLIWPGAIAPLPESRPTPTRPCRWPTLPRGAHSLLAGSCGYG